MLEPDDWIRLAGSCDRCAERASPLRDREFESCSLQEPVCLSGERRGCSRKTPQFGGILRVGGDLRGDVQAANRASFAFLSDGY